MGARTRNVAHLWADKQIIRWFRETFDKATYRNLRLVYIALCEIDSDFREKPVASLSKTIQTYAGVSRRITTPIIFFLEELKIIEVTQLKTKGKFSHNSILRLMEWYNQEKDYKNNSSYYNDILAGNEQRRKKSPLVTNVASDKCTHYKNTKVSISKNDKSSNKLSKDNNSSASTTGKKRIIKIKKKVNPVQDDKKKYPVIVHQVYRELIEKGATNHRKDSKVYDYTLDQIHRLLSHRAKNPFADIQDHDVNERKNKFSADDLIEAFEYHIEYSKKMHRKPIKNIGSFILMKGWGDKSPYSPFLVARYNKSKHDYTGATGDVKVLMRECERINVKFSQSQALRVLKILEEKTKKMFIPTSLHHLYFGKPFYIFLEYLDERVRKKRIPLQVLCSEGFVDNFIDDAVYKQTLVRGNGHCAY